MVELWQGKYELICPRYPEFDLTKPETIKAVIERAKPETIVHLAAYTDVGGAEEERGNKEGLCYQINVVGSKNLVEASGQIPIIHISTDMVFEGKNGPYAEKAVLPENGDNLTWYGWTKGLAEKEMRQVGATIVRLIYPVKAQLDQKLDYIHRPLQLLAEDKLYPLFADQQISISFIDQVAETLDKIIEGDKKGIFHASTDLTSPYELIRYVVEKLGQDPNQVKTGSVVEFLKGRQDGYRYPVKGGLLVEETEQELGIKFLNWRQMVEVMIDQGLSLAKN